MSKEDYFVLKPFGPSIVKLKIPENLVDKLNSYVDKVVPIAIIKFGPSD